MLNKC